MNAIATNELYYQQLTPLVAFTSTSESQTSTSLYQNDHTVSLYAVVYPVPTVTKPQYKKKLVLTLQESLKTDAPY